MMDYYIAAPFFNQEQNDLLWQIEQVLEVAQRSYYSPRFSPMNKKTGLIDEDRARGIFDSNVGNLIQCRAVLAVLDWKLPKGKRLQITDENDDAPSPMSLNLPDTGTVWEMGCAWVKGIPIFVYTDRSPKESLNVMLIQCAKGIIYGLNHLREFVNGIRPESKYLGVYR